MIPNTIQLYFIKMVRLNCKIFFYINDTYQNEIFSKKSQEPICRYFFGW